MKNIYQTPETNILFVELQAMMAGSITANPEEGFNLNDSPDTPDTYGNLSRRHRDAWGDEEEEEEF